MGVCSVHLLTPTESEVSGPLMLDKYTEQLEALGAKKCGTYSVECDTYLSSSTIVGLGTIPKSINLITCSEYPASAFVLMENGLIVTTDSSIEQILSNLSNFYSIRNFSRMEVRGQRWSLGDFIIKMGSCTMGVTFKSNMVEIEYGPCCVPNNCWDLIKELGQTFIGPAISSPHPHVVKRMNETYSPNDTIQQYQELFNQLRKIPTTQVPKT